MWGLYWGWIPNLDTFMAPTKLLQCNRVFKLPCLSVPNFEEEERLCQVRLWNIVLFCRLLRNGESTAHGNLIRYSVWVCLISSLHISDHCILRITLSLWTFHQGQFKLSNSVWDEWANSRIFLLYLKVRFNWYNSVFPTELQSMRGGSWQGRGLLIILCHLSEVGGFCGSVNAALVDVFCPSEALVEFESWVG